MHTAVQVIFHKAAVHDLAALPHATFHRHRTVTLMDMSLFYVSCCLPATLHIMYELTYSWDSFSAIVPNLGLD